MRKTMVTVLAVIGLLAVGGCGTGTGTSRSAASGAALPTDGVRLYGTDGNMGNGLGTSLKDRPGVLAGMKGTAPISPLTEELKSRLRAVQPGLKDYSYAGQTYDAVVIAGLATEIARTTKGSEVARYLPGVTFGGEDCETVAACLAAIRKGKDVRYRGASLRRGGFTDRGEPSTATYGTLHFGRDNTIDDAMTEYVGAGNEADTSQAAPPAPPPLDKNPSGVPLVLGGLLPKTGQLASMYPPLIAGAKLGVKELNDAGGVLGDPVKWVDGDDGTSPDKAKQTVETLLGQRVHVIIGAGASGVSKEVIPRVTGAGVLMISPSSTSDELTQVPDNNLFFRTAGPDQLQARALADIVMRDGSRRVYLVSRDDSWGQGLTRNLVANLATAGVAADEIEVFDYAPGSAVAPEPNLAGLVDGVRSFAPDALVIIGFDESAAVIEALVAGGVPLHG